MSLWSRIDDRWNPIFIREVRQALRSKGFTTSFIVVIILALAITGGLYADNLDDWTTPRRAMGPVLFQGMYGCLLLALVVVVPLNAFLAMSEEWNAATWEQLSLSGLSPMQIVRGRFFSAGVQGLLFSAGLMPFVAITLLMQGLDFVHVGFGLCLAVLSSVAFTFLAIAAGAFRGPKQMRITLMAVYAGLLLLCGLGMLSFLDELTRNRIRLGSDEFFWTAVTFGLTGLVLSIYGAFSAAALLTHPFENRSSSLRAVTAGVMFIGALCVAWMYWDNPDSGGPYFIATGGLYAFSILAALFSTELEPMSIRVRRSVSTNPVLALLSAPFLPGGGRGFLYQVLVSGGFALSCAAVFHFLPERTSALCRIGYGVLYAAGTTCLVFVGLIAGVFAFARPSLNTRLVSYVCITLAVVTGTVLSIVHLNFNGDDHSLWILVNPFLLPGLYWGGTWKSRGIYESHLMLLSGLAAMALIINAPRMFRGVAEVLAASRQNRALRKNA